MQIKFKLVEPFLFGFYSPEQRKEYFGCFDMAKNKLVKKHIFEGDILGCIQVHSSLYAYKEDGRQDFGTWSALSNFQSETIVENQLSRPKFTHRLRFGIANFSDQLIFITGGTAIQGE